MSLRVVFFFSATHVTTKFGTGNLLPTAEISLHVCVVGVWLCLNCMGHHVWKIVTAESVFTRVTDGRRLACYTAYVAAALATITGVAVAVNFLVVHETEEEEEEQEEGREEGDGEGGNVKRGAVLSELRKRDN